MHILVVDPNEAFGTLLSEELLLLGYTVDQVLSGEEAIEVVQQNTPSLAVLDMALEAPDAMTLAVELRAHNPSLRLMMIPLMGESLRMEEDDVDIQGVLPKPFFIPELGQRIASALGIAEPVVDAGPFTAPDMLPDPDPDDAPYAPTEVVETDGFRQETVVTPVGFGRYAANAERVKSLLDNLLFEIGADAVVLTLDDTLLTWVGSFSEMEAQSIAQVVIHGWRSSEEVARILGREQLRFEQSIAGGSYMLYALSVDVHAIMAVAVRGTASLGMIRHRAREVADQVTALCVDR
ncbi:MAG: response regulator [Anaerolineae bacterium]|nr:response regulator [Anaerolineae bacterium]